MLRPEGLTTKEAKELLRTAGPNSMGKVEGKGFLRLVFDLIREPMTALLLVACLLYFLLREPDQGLLMLAAIVFVSAISVYQERKSSRALAALRKYVEPKVGCLRDGILVMIDSEELVPGDVMLVEEGQAVAADGVVLVANDFSVNESVVTGESFPVLKDGGEGNNQLYQGSMVNSGKCYARVVKTGSSTLLGQIGRRTEAVVAVPTLLQVQIGRFVRSMTVFGVGAFAVVLVFGYLRTADWAQSLLLSLTLAMSAIPEEIPVAFSSFMALGAWRMARLGIVVRQPLTVESLGAVSVICLDKTGTLTENKMTVSALYDKRTEGDGVGDGRPMVVWFARLASEPEPFDAMEQAIVVASEGCGFSRAYSELRFVHEYPLEGKPPMMTHVYRNGEGCVAAAKGGVERIMEVSRLSAVERKNMERVAADMAGKGYRVLGVASAGCVEGGFPERQENFDWRFEGLVAFNDPPKANLAPVLAEWTKAGIRIKILSGDHLETVVNIARAAGVSPGSSFLTGEQVMAFSEEQLRREVVDTVVFARMFPEAKLRVIETLKASGETVAMTGDGVNDGPALKAAHIGIAMGERGTEIARQAADLVVSDDKLEKITEAIRHGRGIYANLQKAIRYLITIHIPILTTASLPVLLGWKFTTVFSPIHLIFLELIMGPTCSVFYEREPVDAGVMSRPPEVRTRGLLGRKESLLTIAQGGIVAVGLLGLYYYFMRRGFSLEYTRTVVFDTLVLDNILLTFSGRSATAGIFKTMRIRNELVWPVVLLSLGFVVVINLWPLVRGIFGLTGLVPRHILACLGVAVLSVGWVEIVKAMQKKTA